MEDEAAWVEAASRDLLGAGSFYLEIQVLFFFNDTAPTEIYTLSLHDALPIFPLIIGLLYAGLVYGILFLSKVELQRAADGRSEEHTSELQSRPHLVCRLLLEKKKNTLEFDIQSHTL